MATWEIREPVLSEALQRKNERFDLASWTASGCFDCCFILEEKFFWVRVSIKLREDSWVEAWRPLELFEFCQKRSAKALLRLMLMQHYIFSFLFIRVQLFFDDNGLVAKPLGLRRLRHRLRVLPRVCCNIAK